MAPRGPFKRAGSTAVVHCVWEGEGDSGDLDADAHERLVSRRAFYIESIGGLVPQDIDKDEC